ncbi:hypothetical protein M433DRAFT_152776 [Acidomyces richmondensis BFW]|nr:hypothetical protein M433DRAFT_152776 [Acidomyces richmondensis BFW]
MQSKQDSQSAPPKHPPSPPKSLVPVHGNSEVAPGPNAFAQQRARMERHRLQSNAFYQQEMQRRRVTPPTDMHPALRTGVLNESKPSFTRQLASGGASLYSSNAGTGNTQQPLLKVDPFPAVGRESDPYQGGRSEELDEQLAHEQSGAECEYMTVYNTWNPTSTAASQEFNAPKPAVSFSANVGQGIDTRRQASSKPSASLPKQQESAYVPEGQRSPKKSFFDRLRFGKSGGGTSPSASIHSLNSIGTVYETESDQNLPMKAQAVQGASPRKVVAGSVSSKIRPGVSVSSNAFGSSSASTFTSNCLSRSPSKQKKSLFSARKPMEATETDPSWQVPQNLAGNATMESPCSVGSQGDQKPKTGISDPSHNNLSNGKHVLSHSSDHSTHYDQKPNHRTIIRSQSLKYMDSAPPPTPPSKDTPPHEKAQKFDTHGLGISNCSAFNQMQGLPPSTPADMISISDRTSPTKFGSYGRRETPKLVTKASIYSLHASVIPDMIEPTAFEEMKARIDGLSLEGFNNPSEPDIYHHSPPEIAYSPSIYCDDYAIKAGRTPRTGHRKTMDDLPTLIEESDRSVNANDRTKQLFFTNAIGEGAPRCYPELPTDQSMQEESTPRIDITSHCAPSDQDKHSYNKDKIPVHGRTHSHHHLDSPRNSIDSTLFSMAMPDERVSDLQTSPSSFNHPSAVPSPLHYLPATVYTPPPRKPRTQLESGGENVKSTTVAAHAAVDMSEELELASSELCNSGLSSRSNNILDTAPKLEANPPRESGPNASNGLANIISDVDPKKPELTVYQARDKQDQMLDMLAKLMSRNEDLASMREEMRAANARIDERLAAVENIYHCSIPSPNQSLHSDDHGMLKFDGNKLADSHRVQNDLCSNQLRVATSFAHDFYRQRLLHEPTPPVASEGGDPTNLPPYQIDQKSCSNFPNETLEELREKNRRLAEMVHGFATQLDEIRKKMGQDDV